MSQTKPFFIPQKEFDLINQMNEELIDEIIGQSVDIYKINTEHTKGNIYGESTTKYFNVGFRVNCLIRYNAPEVEQFNDVGPDVNSTIDLNFQRNNLASGSLNLPLNFRLLCNCSTSHRLRSRKNQRPISQHDRTKEWLVHFSNQINN